MNVEWFCEAVKGNRFSHSWVPFLSSNVVGNKYLLSSVTFDIGRVCFAFLRGFYTEGRESKNIRLRLSTISTKDIPSINRVSLTFQCPFELLNLHKSSVAKHLPQFNSIFKPLTMSLERFLYVSEYVC